ncbi:MAG: hypothetical protein K2Q06_02510 [Parvularculaceae bacterium]|nr:hypothetical protein [Parvularculaceae bacterium]
MRPLELTPELRLAARCVWFEPAERAVANPARLVAYVLTYGLPEDVAALRTQMPDDDLREALDHAPPGIFDARSWAYWNLVLGRTDPPPMPQRRLP